MEDIPMECTDDLSIILGNYKHDPKSRSVNSFLQQLDFDPNSAKYIFTGRNSAHMIKSYDFNASNNENSI